MYRFLFFHTQKETSLNSFTKSFRTDSISSPLLTPSLPYNRIYSKKNRIGGFPMQSLQSTVTLNNGVAMPIFGLGVYNSKEETTFAVSTAIRHGYRLIDILPHFTKTKKKSVKGLKTVEFHETIYLLQPNSGTTCSARAASVNHSKKFRQPWCRCRRFISHPLANTRQNQRNVACAGTII